MLLAEVQETEGRTRTWLEPGGDELRIETSDGNLTFVTLPPGAVQRVMLRFGKELTEALESDVAAGSVSVALTDGSVLRAFRYRPRYDVIAKDYVVWSTPGAPSRIELAVTVAAALTHLGRAHALSAALRA